MLRLARLRRYDADPVVFPDLSRLRPWAPVVARDVAFALPLPEHVSA
jgi:hypothetical protein